MKSGIVACAFLVVIALGSGCSPRFDLEEPIAIVIDNADLANHYSRVITNAAGCWEQQFEIPFVVTNEPTDTNYISVVLDDLTCVSFEGGDATSMGRFFAGRPAKISLCAWDHRDTPYDPASYYFRVVLHELGHASGIYGEGTRANSVMGLANHIYAGNHAFSEEDRALLEDAVGPRPSTCAAPIVFTGSSAGCQCLL